MEKAGGNCVYCSMVGEDIHKQSLLERGCGNCAYCNKAAEYIHKQAEMGGYEVPSNTVHIDIPSDDDDNVNDDGGRVKKARKLRRNVRKKDKKLKRITLRGPLMKGGKQYDKQCVFGNDVEMTADQVAYLTDLVAGYKPFIPYYVCKMTYSNIIPGKAKMYFSARYNNAHPNQYLPTEIPVICAEQAAEVEDVRFIVGKNGVSQMTSKWADVLKAAKISKGDLCVFTFFIEKRQCLIGHVVCLN